MAMQTIISKQLNNEVYSGSGAIGSNLRSELGKRKILRLS
jgi:hypothetical protein